MWPCGPFSAKVYREVRSAKCIRQALIRCSSRLAGGDSRLATVIRILVGVRDCWSAKMHRGFQCSLTLPFPAWCSPAVPQTDPEPKTCSFEGRNKSSSFLTDWSLDLSVRKLRRIWDSGPGL